MEIKHYKVWDGSRISLQDTKKQDISIKAIPHEDGIGEIILFDIKVEYETLRFSLTPSQVKELAQAFHYIYANVK